MIHIGRGTITLNGDKEEPGGEGGDVVGRRESELDSGGSSRIIQKDIFYLVYLLV